MSGACNQAVRNPPKRNHSELRRDDDDQRAKVISTCERCDEADVWIGEVGWSTGRSLVPPTVRQPKRPRVSLSLQPVGWGWHHSQQEPDEWRAELLAGVWHEGETILSTEVVVAPKDPMVLARP